MFVFIFFAISLFLGPLLSHFYIKALDKSISNVRDILTCKGYY